MSVTPALDLSAWTAPGPLALVGSGEYLPDMAPIEAALLAGRPPRYVQLATAAVPDGPDVVARWHRLGAEQAARVGAEAVVVPVATRDDADDPALAAMVAGAGLIYLSGGNPSFLADTLRASAVWAAIVEAWRAGAALAGCSAGAMVMAARVPSFRHPRRGDTEGLALLAHLRVIPHFDAFLGRIPQVAGALVSGAGDGVTVLGVDEMTAIVGGPSRFTVVGRSSAWRLEGASRHELPSGTTFEVPLPG